MVYTLPFKTGLDVTRSKSIKDVTAAFNSGIPKFVRPAASHPLLPRQIAIDFIEKHLDGNVGRKSTLLWLCFNPTLDESYLLTLVPKLRYDHRYCGNAITSNPNCTSKVVYALMRTKFKELRAAASASPLLGEKGAHLALIDTNAEVRVGLASNDKWIVRYGKKLSKDRSKFVRLAVAKCKGTSKDVLLSMLKDRDAMVKDMVLNQIKSRMTGWRN